MIQKEKVDLIGGVSKKETKNAVELDLPLFKFVKKRKRSSFLLSSRGKGALFLAGAWNGNETVRREMFIDSLFSPAGVSNRSLEYLAKSEADIYLEIRERYANVKNYWLDLFQDSVRGVSLVRAWNVSLISSVIFGMFLMTMIYRYLGQGAAAKIGVAESVSQSSKELVLGEETSVEIISEESVKDFDSEKLAREREDLVEKKREYEKKLSFEKEIKKMVKGYPIEKMAAEIAKKDRTVGAYLVAIAKKESSWGERVPVLEGEDCYNYWGYRGKRERMGTGGHTCFSPKDAVDTVAKRIAQLVNEEKLNTPEEMVVAWKCGYDCSWDDPAAVRKWVSDVEGYFDELR